MGGLEFVEVSNEKVPGLDFTPGVGIGTWKVVGGTGSTPRSPEAEGVASRVTPVARAAGGLPHPSRNCAEPDGAACEEQSRSVSWLAFSCARPP